MTGQELRRAREQKGWTQEEAASRLHMSQEYLSMLERGFRSLPAARLRTVLKTYKVSPLAIPLQGQREWARLDNQQFALQLAGLGYPGFGHLKAHATWNPQEVLTAALTKSNLERRIVEALPWLILKYNQLD